MSRIEYLRERANKYLADYNKCGDYLFTAEEIMDLFSHIDKLESRGKELEIDVLTLTEGLDVMKERAEKAESRAKELESGTSFLPVSWNIPDESIQEELITMREALQFYADKEIWNIKYDTFGGWESSTTKAQEDSGERARKALGE